ncbi:MAG: DUF2442 domain-containing protein, partial [Magnetococcales bacterium]|nr:DUF2442 domain-containing protein [Magnetococcales bacterium]
MQTTKDVFYVVLVDGWEMAIPLTWFQDPPWMSCLEWRFIGNGARIHWKEMDADISIESPGTRQSQRKKPGNPSVLSYAAETFR